MDDKNNDWRLQGQEKYLFNKTLVHKKYGDKTTTTDHDHCEFCSDKFSTTIPGCLTEGFTTTDNYHWICEKCLLDFKNDFKWEIIKQ